MKLSGAVQVREWHAMILMFFSWYSSSMEGFLFLLQTLASLVLVAYGLVTDLPDMCFSLCCCSDAALLWIWLSRKIWNILEQGEVCPKKIAGSEFWVSHDFLDADFASTKQVTWGWDVEEQNCQVAVSAKAELHTGGLSCEAWLLWCRKWATLPQRSWLKQGCRTLRDPLLPLLYLAPISCLI